MAAIDAHKKYYKQHIDNLREERREKIRVKEHKQFNDDTNIGMKVCWFYNWTVSVILPHKMEIYTMFKLATWVTSIKFKVVIFKIHSPMLSLYV